jgi:hypothetical protein
MSDPKILQIQTDLKTLGFDPGPLDGLLGDKTRAALLLYTQGVGADAASVLSDPSRLHQEAQAKLSPVALPPQYLDLSDRCTNKEWRKKERPWSEITGVTLHQTGCPMASHPERWLNLKAHYGVTYGGGLYRIHPETAFGWHGQGLSHHTIGIEIAGCFEGIDGNPKTFPGLKGWAIQRITQEQIEAAKELVRYLKRLVAAHGGQLTGIYPHRIATDDRTADPGERAWKEVARPLMDELGLSDGGEGFTLGKGEPIPGAWDPRYKAGY